MKGLSLADDKTSLHVVCTTAARAAAAVHAGNSLAAVTVSCRAYRMNYKIHVLTAKSFRLANVAKVPGSIPAKFVGCKGTDEALSNKVLFK
jgi:hypothetical protein